MAEGKLTIWNGGTRVFPIEPKPTVKATTEEVPGQDRFSTCGHRSNEQITKVVRTCCSSKEMFGYICHKTLVHPLAPGHCVGCPMYAPPEKAE